MGETMSLQQERNVKVLWGWIAFAVVYSVVLRLLPTLTAWPTMEVYVTVAVGLYICTHPAANAIKLLYLERYSLHQLASDKEMLRWLGLNLLVLLAGCTVIYTGLLELAETIATLGG